MVQFSEFARFPCSIPGEICVPQTSHKGSAKALDSPICNEAQSQQCGTSDLNQAGLLATPLRGLNIQPMVLFVACPAERARIPRPAGTTRPSAEEIERSTRPRTAGAQSSARARSASPAFFLFLSFLVSWSGQETAEPLSGHSGLRPLLPRVNHFVFR